MYSDEEGRRAVKLARRVVEAVVRGDSIGEIAYPQKFENAAGVFTTLKLYPSGELRGCIGYPDPTLRIIETIVNSARSAAMRDPRFNPVTVEELDGLIVEVSLLTPPEKVQVDDPSEYLERIVVGKHGLIVKRSLATGLLLPQVPVEWNWDVKEFLEHACLKAGVERNSWKRPSTEIFSFQGEVFAESNPGGEIRRVPVDGGE